MMAMVVCLAGAVPVVAIEMAEPQGWAFAVGFVAATLR